MSTGIQHTLISTNGIKLHAVTAGPESGPAIIFLHGFPEFWFGWRKQIDHFAGAGYRVIAPDLRGYNLSDKPNDVYDYRFEMLVKDVLGLVGTVKWHQMSLVGHDWGGALAFYVANRLPARINRLVVINAPHFAVFQRLLRHNVRQLWRSRYMFYFQIPWLPEQLLGMGGERMLERAVRKSAQPGAFSREEFAEYHKAWAQPNALTSMINWYRAMYRFRPPMPEDTTIQVATRLIWGARDKFLGPELARASIEQCPYGELTMIDDATHWVHHEQPERVNTLIAEFLRGS